MFWIKVDVVEDGRVKVSTFDLNISGNPHNVIRVRWGATVAQALRSLAAGMVHAEAEKVK